MIFFQDATFPVWTVVPTYVNITEQHFKNTIFKIRNIVYKEYTAEFEDALKAEKMWERLGG